MPEFFLRIEAKRVRITLRRRKPQGPFYCRWSYQGQQHYHATGKLTEVEAKSIASDLVEHHASIVPGVHPRLSVIIPAYLDSKWPKACSTRTEAKNRLAYFQAAVKDMFFTRLTRDEATAVVRKYLKDRPVGPQSLKNERRVISAFCSWLISHDRVSWQENPARAAKVKTPRVVKRKKPSIPDSAVEALLRLATGPLRAAAVLLLSGVRPRSIVERLMWADVNFQRQTVKTIEKEDDEREIALGSWAIGELRPLARKGRVWPLTPDMLWYGFKEISEAIHVKITPQALRRKFTNIMQHFKVSAYDESALAGHSLAVADKSYREDHAATLHAVANLVSFGAKSGYSSTEKGCEQYIQSFDV